MHNLLLLAAGAAEHSEHAEPIALGLTPPMWVAASMAVLVIVALVLKVPAMLTSGLDASIAEIKKQLD
jgi:F-type H+-transporting ATPase subunit b